MKSSQTDGGHDLNCRDRKGLRTRGRGSKFASVIASPELVDNTSPFVHKTQGIGLHLITNTSTQMIWSRIGVEFKRQTTAYIWIRSKGVVEFYEKGFEFSFKELILRVRLVSRKVWFNVNETKGPYSSDYLNEYYCQNIPDTVHAFQLEWVLVLENEEEVELIHVVKVETLPLFWTCSFFYFDKVNLLVRHAHYGPKKRALDFQCLRPIQKLAEEDLECTRKITDNSGA